MRPRLLAYARAWWFALRPQRNSSRFILRVSTSEACGPSGAGARAGDRNPRRDSGIKLTTPRKFR